MKRSMHNGAYDVIVLGLGGMGASAAFELARRGLSVLGLEQFSLAHDRGSSHGRTRVIRKAYFEHPSYVPLLHRAYERWYALEQRLGHTLLVTCGVLSLGPSESSLIAGVQASAHTHGLAIETFDIDALRRRYPLFSLPEDTVGVLEASGGFLWVEDCVHAHLIEAKRLGALLKDDEPVLSWQADAAGVSVETTRGRYLAQKLVIAGGAWAGHLLKDLGLPLMPHRTVQCWFQPENETPFRRDRFPIYIADLPGGVFYGFPAVDDWGHKCALHQPGEPVANPSELNRHVSEADESSLRALLRRYLPAADGPLQRARVCMYTMTPDQHFVLDIHPEFPRVAMAAGFSGHGYKFASVVGEVLADFVEHGRTELPVSMFAVNRFGVQKK